MRSDSVKNMSAYADQNHAPSLAAARLEITYSDVTGSVLLTGKRISKQTESPEHT